MAQAFYAVAVKEFVGNDPETGDELDRVRKPEFAGFVSSGGVRLAYAAQYPKGAMDVALCRVDIDDLAELEAAFPSIVRVADDLDDTKRAAVRVKGKTFTGPARDIVRDIAADFDPSHDVTRVRLPRR